MTVSFVGLGVMGKYMALNLIKSGELIAVNDVATHAFPEFTEKGIVASTELTEVAKAEIIFLSLPNALIVRSVVDKMLPLLRAGQIVVDLGTTKYAATLDMHRLLEDRGIRFLDCPVSGMEARAKDGSLTIMCGGDVAVFERVQPYLQYMGTKILFMGDIGAGQLTKLINQLLFDINAAAIAEILPMSAKLGLDSEKIAEVVNSGTGRSYASEHFIPHILENSFFNGYALKNAYKDLVSAAELGANYGIPMPVLAAATSTYQMALLKGLGNEDKGSMIKVYEDLLGVSFRKKGE